MALDPVEVWNGPLRTPGGRPLHRAVVPIEAVAPLNPLLRDSAGEVLSRVTPDTNTDGIWRASLIPTSQFARVDAYYTADERSVGGQLWAFRVPDSGGPYRLAELLIETPPTGEDPNAQHPDYAVWFSGHGPPPDFLEGAKPGDLYVDDDTDTVYQLR